MDDDAAADDDNDAHRSPPDRRSIDGKKTPKIPRMTPQDRCFADAVAAADDDGDDGGGDDDARQLFQTCCFGDHTRCLTAVAHKVSCPC